jgi:hypothetical protein
MAETAKTWTEVEQDIADTMRKWHVWDYVLDAPYGKLKAAERRQATRMGQTMEQRSVTLRFEWRSPGTWQKRDIKITANSSTTAQENLERVAKAIEGVRLAEVRGGQHLATMLYQQMYPKPGQQQQQTPPPPPRQERVTSTGPYATLHVADDAPLEVAEAAYRALSRSAHPDTNGAQSGHAWMVMLNLAIEKIRAAKARQKAGAR